MTLTRDEMSHSLYPSPKSVAAQPVTEGGEELCDALPRLSLSESPQEKRVRPSCGASGDHSATSSVSFSEFITLLPQTIKNSHSAQREPTIVDIFNEEATKNNDDDISSLFHRLDLRKEDWEPYAFFEPSKLYTRNLVATDDETFTLLLMCWNAGKSSPVHNHPCDGCWMHVCEGRVSEKRYVQQEGCDFLECVSDELYTENQLAYITDSMGLHKVANPSNDERAVTLHLYSPPFKSCKIWLDPNKASKSSNSCMSFHSINGCVVRNASTK